MKINSILRHKLKMVGENEQSIFELLTGWGRNSTVFSNGKFAEACGFPLFLLPTICRSVSMQLIAAHGMCLSPFSFTHTTVTRAY